MPVFNEERTIRTIVRRVLNSPIDADIELVCVDDGSSDDSLEILQELAREDSRITVIAQSANRGKGMAIRAAVDHMTGNLAIIQDADLEYDPEEYPIVLQPILDGRADAVYGSRFAAGSERRVLFYWHSLGNRILTAFSNMANDINLTDMETCYKAFRADVLRGLRLTIDGFGIEPEITARLAKSGARIYEVPISYHGRTYAEGKKIGWKDGIQALWLILKFRFFDTTASKDTGRATLESLAAAPSVAKWTVDQFRAHLGDRVLEAGCGNGNLTGQLLDRQFLVAADIDDRHLRVVQSRFGHLENVQVVQGDLTDPDFYQRLATKFDSVVCVNVLEHIEDPDTALSEFYKTLRPGGAALILVPAHDWLFSIADEALGHHRRYSSDSLRTTLERAGFTIEDLFEFNRLGVAGWWVNGMLGRTKVVRWQATLFSLLMPLARVVERIRPLPGLSLLAIARVTRG